MKIATVAIILRQHKGREQILLGYKKKGEISEHTFNGPGGKCEPGETPLECVIRETREEACIELNPAHLELVAVITFFAKGLPDFEVHFFSTRVFSGEPTETLDMVLSWFDTNALPFDQMLESDSVWFPKLLAGEKFRADIHYAERAAKFEKDKTRFYPL